MVKVTLVKSWLKPARRDLSLVSRDRLSWAVTQALQCCSVTSQPCGLRPSLLQWKRLEQPPTQTRSCLPSYQGSPGQMALTVVTLGTVAQTAELHVEVADDLENSMSAV